MWTENLDQRLSEKPRGTRTTPEYRPSKVNTPRKLTPKEEQAIRDFANSLFDELEAVPSKQGKPTTLSERQKETTIPLNERQKELWFTREMIQELNKFWYIVDESWFIKSTGTDKIWDQDASAVISTRDQWRYSYIMFVKADTITWVSEDGEYLAVGRSNGPTYFIKKVTPSSIPPK